MHNPDGVIDDLAFADQDGRLAVGAAANGEDGVGYCFAAIEWDDGVQAESCKELAERKGLVGDGSLNTFVHHCFEVLHLFELLEGWSFPM